MLKAKRVNENELKLADEDGKTYRLILNSQTGLFRIQANNGPMNIRPVCSNVAEFGSSDWKSKSGIRMG